MESTTTSLQAVPIAPSAIMATAAAGLCTNTAMATQLAAPAGGGHGEQAAAFLYMISVLLQLGCHCNSDVQCSCEEACT